MEDQYEHQETRRQEIRDRIAAIRTRIDDLRQARESRISGASSEQLIEAQHHAAASRATAQQALASSIEGLLRAAQAHERSAISYERLAAAAGSDDEQYRKQAAHHRAAAAADRQRAETAKTLFSSRAENSHEDEGQGRDGAYAPTQETTGTGITVHTGP